jgi:hypothetical protein
VESKQRLQFERALQLLLQHLQKLNQPWKHVLVSCVAFGNRAVGGPHLKFDTEIIGYVA